MFVPDDLEVEKKEISEVRVFSSGKAEVTDTDLPTPAAQTSTENPRHLDVQFMVQERRSLLGTQGQRVLVH